MSILGRYMRVLLLSCLLCGCRASRPALSEGLLSEGVRPVSILGDTAVVRYRLSAPVALEPLSSEGKGMDVRAVVKDQVLTVSARSEPREVPVPYVVVQKAPERVVRSAGGGWWFGGGVLAALLLALLLNRRRV